MSVDCCSLLLVAQLAPVQATLFSAGTGDWLCSSTEDVFWDGKWNAFSQRLWRLRGKHQCICTKVCWVCCSLTPFFFLHLLLCCPFVSDVYFVTSVVHVNLFLIHSHVEDRAKTLWTSVDEDV